MYFTVRSQDMVLPTHVVTRALLCECRTSYWITCRDFICRC